MGGQRAQKRGFGTILEAGYDKFGRKDGNGEHRPQKCVQEILRGSQYDQKYPFFLGVGCLGGRLERFR